MRVLVFASVALLLSASVVWGQCANGQCQQQWQPYHVQQWRPHHVQQWQPYRVQQWQPSGTSSTVQRQWPDNQADVVAGHPTILRAFAAINATRQRNGRAPLVLDARLCLESQRHAERMEWRGMHHDPNGGAECIYCGPRTASVAVNGWARSTDHFRIMLSGTRCGIGYSTARGRRSWVLRVR